VPADWLVVGLGNPGADYAGTRHNVGADTVALLAGRRGASLRRSRHRAVTADVAIDGARVVLAFPQTYYNESGQAVASLCRWHHLEADRVVVVHDELDLPPGRVKVKVGGGLAGNNGLKSIKSHLHSDGFARVRIGVGKPPGRMEGADHVLRRPGKAERTELDVAVEEAADAVELLVTAGPDRAMDRYNARGEPTP
jgi:PTH1 family peptidyl-tRNA hydrolase